MTFLVCLSILFILLDGRFHALERVHAVGERLALPLRVSTAWPGVFINNIAGYFTDKVQLLQQNVTLQQTLTMDQVKLQQLAQIQQENQALKTALHFQQTSTLPLVMTTIVSAKGYPYLERFFIRHQPGSMINSAVLAADGVVGQVISSNSAIDTVLPIVDTASYVPVQTSDHSLRAIAQGDGVNGLLIQQIAKSNAVAIGQEFVTSGLDGIYPAGYSVGKVVAIVPSSDHLFLTLTLRPSLNLSALNYVAVMTPGKENA